MLAEESAARRPVTINDLIAETLARNPELAFYEAELASAKGERRQAGTWQNPELSSELGRKRVRGDVAAEGTVWSVTASQTFEWPGRVSLRKAIANNQIQLAELGLEQFRTALASQVRQKAYALFAAQRRLQAAQEVAARGEELVETLVQREPAGVAPLLETRAIEASVIKLKREGLDAAKEVKASLYELNQLRGAALSEELEITEPPASLPPLPPKDALVQLAAKHNFDLKEREIELVQQGFKVRLAANEAWPSITAGPVVSQEKADERETVVGLEVSVPLALWDRNKGNVDVARARELQAATSLQVAQRQVERELLEQLTIYEISVKEIARQSPEIVSQLRDAALLADRHYRLGAVPLSTYLEVQESYLEALEAIYETRADAMTAWLTLNELTGNQLSH